MTASFSESSFLFREGEKIPDNEGRLVGLDERDRGLWHLDGLDTFSHDSYRLADNLPSQDVAEFLAQARLRKLEGSQPTESSGGQQGIQDKVYIVHPGGRSVYFAGSKMTTVSYD